MSNKTPDTSTEQREAEGIPKRVTDQHEDQYDALMTAEESALSAEAVLAYLHSHPDFFVQHEQTLAELAISHEAGGATSLLERQVLTLRARNRELGEQIHSQQRRADEQLAELVSIARGNEKQAQQLYAFAVHLIGLIQQSTDASSVREAALSYLQQQFNLSVVTVVPALPESGESEPAQTLANIMRYGTPVCGAADLDEVQAVLTPEQLATVQSAAIVPIRRGDHGEDLILALGSDDAMRFHSRLGTQFLRELAKLLTPVL